MADLNQSIEKLWRELEAQKLPSTADAAYNERMYKAAKKGAEEITMRLAPAIQHQALEQVRGEMGKGQKDPLGPLPPDVRDSINEVGKQFHNALMTPEQRRDQKIDAIVREDAQFGIPGLDKEREPEFDRMEGSPEMKGKSHVKDPSLVTQTAKQIARDPAYQQLTQEDKAAWGRLQTYENELKEKYKDAPRATGKGDPDKRLFLGGRVIDLDPREKAQYGALEKTSNDAAMATSSHISDRAAAAGVSQEDSIFVTRAVNGSYEPPAPPPPAPAREAPGRGGGIGHR